MDVGMLRAELGKDRVNSRASLLCAFLEKLAQVSHRECLEHHMGLF